MVEFNKQKRQLLLNEFYRAKFINGPYSGCIKWAISELESGSENIWVAYLAGLNENDYWEILKVIENIFEEKLSDNNENEENWAGKYIVEIASKYRAGEIDILKLSEIIDILYYRLDYPSWLTMLSRNCEYATDIIDFLKPFNDELDYIVELWTKAIDIQEFKQLYDRKISNTHDYKQKY
jgi:hypothetical protein